MSHAALKKFDQVLARYSAHAGILSAVPVDQTDPGRLEILEAEIGSKLPPAVHALLSRYDGERQGAEGLFLGHGLMSIGRIKDGVAYAQTLIKPELPYVVDLAASQAILEAIVVEVMALVDRTARSGMFAQNWNRCAFGCSPNSGDGPYIYLTTDTPDTDRIVVGYDAATLDRLTKLSGDLHQIERETFNWDDLKFAVNRDGQFVVSRDFYRLTGEDNFTSFPEGAVKRDRERASLSRFALLECGPRRAEASGMRRMRP